MTREQRSRLAEDLLGKEFPCPLCGMSLEIRLSRVEKPYCICDACGIQLFFRAKLGIVRLHEIIKSETLIASPGPNFTEATILYNRIQQLRARKKELQQKQGLIIRDPDLDNAILAHENEIARVQAELDKVAHNTRARGKAKE